MKIRNDYNLPEAVRKAVETSTHRQGDYSVTQLLKGVKEIALEKLVGDELEDDCSERFWALFGTACHKVLEQQETEGIMNEHFMSVQIGDRTVTGTADVVDEIEGKVVDYKTCTSWKLVFQDFSDWKEQIKSYLYLLRHEQIYFEKGEVIAIIRDWSQTQAERDPNYPQKPIVVIPFEYTDEEIEEVGEMWADKIAKVEQAIKNIINKGEDSVECCSDEETWTTQTTWAVMKEGRKTAIRVYDNQEEAEERAEQENGYVEERKGEHKKCERYCILAKNGYCRGRK